MWGQQKKQVVEFGPVKLGPPVHCKIKKCTKRSHIHYCLFSFYIPNVWALSEYSILLTHPVHREICKSKGCNTKTSTVTEIYFFHNKFTKQGNQNTKQLYIFQSDLATFHYTSNCQIAEKKISIPAQCVMNETIPDIHTTFLNFCKV